MNHPSQKQDYALENVRPVLGKREISSTVETVKGDKVEVETCDLQTDDPVTFAK
jgi:hypothetical protein